MHTKPRRTLHFVVVILLVLTLVATTLLSSSAAPAGAYTTFLPLVAGRSGTGCAGFTDDFSDPGSGWVESSTTNYDMEYDNGEFRILLKTPIGTSAYNQDLTPRTGDLTASSDMRWEGETGHAYGLGFHTSYNDGYEIYEVLVEPGTQQYRVEYFNLEDGDIDLIPNTFSGAIHPGNASNHLLVQKVGAVATIFINDMVVNTFTIQDSKDAAYVRLAADAYPDYPVSASRFDNFCLD